MKTQHTPALKTFLFAAASALALATIPASADPLDTAFSGDATTEKNAALRVAINAYAETPSNESWAAVLDAITAARGVPSGLPFTEFSVATTTSGRIDVPAGAAGAVHLLPDVSFTFKNGYDIDNFGGALSFGTGSVSIFTAAANARYIFESNLAYHGGVIYNSATFALADVDFTGNFAHESGGAIYNGGDGSIVISGTSTFDENNAITGDGGAIFNAGGSIAISGTSTFDGNNAGNGSGGAILNNGGSIAISGTSTFDRNNAGSGSGGAILNAGGTSIVTLADATFSRNYVENDGGAILNAGGSIAISGTSTFDGNVAGNGNGGAILNTGSASIVTLADATFSHNYALNGGGAIYNYDGTVTLTNASFTNNTTEGNGGAIFNFGDGSTVTLADATFAHNEADNGGSGGAIYNANRGTVTISGLATFNHNTVQNGGGAIFNIGDGSIVTLADATFTENTAILSGGAIFNASRGIVSISGTTTFNHNIGYDGGAISNIGGKIEISGPAIFTNNEIGDYSNGGAIYNNSGGTVSISGPATFTSNKAIFGSGGAIANSDGATVSISGSATFDENVVYSNGGAISNIDTDSTFKLANASFIANRSTDCGGAIYNRDYAAIEISGKTTFENNNSGYGGAIYNDDSATVSISGSVTFIGNTATSHGGAIYNDGSSIIEISGSATFIENTATGYGGAIYNWESVVSLTNAAFTNNHADSYGGAISNRENSSVNLIVTEGRTGLFSGNSAGSERNSVYFDGSNLNIVTAAAGVLDMRDPFRVSDEGETIITKSGVGTWNLGNESHLASGNNSILIDIAEGTLHLYAAGEVTNVTAAGRIEGTGANGASFTLGNGATLSAGGGNSIKVQTITLNTGSTLAFDLSGAAPNASSVDTPGVGNAVLRLAGTVGFDFSLGSGINIDIRSFNATAGNYTLVYGGNFVGKLSSNTVTVRGEQIAGTRAAALFTSAIIPAGNGIVVTQGALKSAVVTWDGGSDDWNISAVKWQGNDTASEPVTRFLHGDVVNFSTEGTANIAINAGGIQAAGINFSGSGHYVFSGGTLVTKGSGTSLTGDAVNGTITLGAVAANSESAATATLDIAAGFSGTVEIANAGTNTFFGGVHVFGGTLIIGGKAQINLEQSILSMNPNTTLEIGAETRITTNGIGGVFLSGSTVIFDILSTSNYGQIWSDDSRVTGASVQLALGEDFIRDAQVGTVLDLFRGEDGGNHAVAGFVLVTDANGNFVWEVNAATGQATIVTVNTTPVPEPGTYALFGAVGVAALALLRRRKRAKN